jgi:transglutaminase-like putative cysteine protease
MRTPTLTLLLVAPLLLLTGTAFSPGVAVTHLLATNNEYAVIDAYARATPERHARSLNTLTDYLTAPAHNELAKARSIYSWMLSHIRYGNAAGDPTTYVSELDYANRILANRRGVCTGFALLFKWMLKRAGVDARTVRGYSRTLDQEAGQPIRQPRHEWNAVRLDGDWYLFDLAWASNTQRDNRPNDFYFLTDPETFVAQHLPSDPRWQLLQPAVSKAEFDRFPKLHDAYFRLGFDPDFPRAGLLRAGETVTLTLTNTSYPVQFSCSVGRAGTYAASSVPLQVQRVGDSYRLTLPITQRGSSTVYVYAAIKNKPADGITKYEGVATFTVVRS